MDVCCGNDCGWNTSSEKCKSSPRIYRGEVGLWSDTRKEPWEPGPAAAGKRGRTPGGPAGQPARQPARPFPAPPSVPHACLWAGAGLSLPLCNTVRSSPSHHPRPLLGVLNNNFQTNCEMERILQQTNAMCLLPGGMMDLNASGRSNKASKITGCYSLSFIIFSAHPADQPPCFLLQPTRPNPKRPTISTSKGTGVAQKWGNTTVPCSWHLGDKGPAPIPSLHRHRTC